MELKPQFRHDPEANALYIRFTDAPVARTVELEQLVYVDLDDTGKPLGIEFVDADDFIPFLKRHQGSVELPNYPLGEPMAAK